MARLFVLSGTSVGATFDIDGTVVLGRGDDADVVVREPSVSRRHARLVPQPEAGVWKVVDLDSANGVHSDGRRVRDALVRDGETFVIGNVEIRLRDQVESEPGAVATDAEPDRAAVVDDDDEAEIELEFDDDLDLQLERASKPAARPRPVEAPGPRPAPSARTPARPRPAPAEAPRDLGRTVIQRAPSGGGSDLSQQPAWVRALLVVLAIALAGGIAYGAFTLTRTVRSQSAVLAD